MLTAPSTAWVAASTTPVERERLVVGGCQVTGHLGPGCPVCRERVEDHLRVRVRRAGPGDPDECVRARVGWDGHIEQLVRELVVRADLGGDAVDRLERGHIGGTSARPAAPGRWQRHPVSYLTASRRHRPRGRVGIPHGSDTSRMSPVGSSTCAERLTSPASTSLPSVGLDRPSGWLLLERRERCLEASEVARPCQWTRSPGHGRRG